MSYILDALRRADAERQHGQVPGLNAQTGASLAGAAPARRAGLLWLAAGALVALLAAGTWWLARPQVPAAVPAAVAPVRPVPDSLPQPAAAGTPVPPSVVPAAPQLPVGVAAPRAAAPPRAATPAAAHASQPQTGAVPLASLSPEQRRDMPTLAVGGSVWSANAGSRFVIFNGQLVHEGELAAPGVVVQSIGPRSAVLRWRDLRVEVPF